jgi:DNA-binding GntR family transcriptional regulator
VGHEGRERAWVEIEHRILIGELAPGDAIDEVALAAELDADGSVLREALCQLERDGFVSSAGEDRFSVTELDEAELRESYPIALLLEGLAVRATDYDDAAVVRLRGLNAEMEAAAGEPSAAAHLDFAFHDELVGHCDNDQLLATLRPLKRMLLRYEHVYMATPEAVLHSVDQHTAIIDAIDAGDLDAAARAVEENFRRSLAGMLDRL